MIVDVLALMILIVIFIVLLTIGRRWADIVADDVIVPTPAYSYASLGQYCTLEELETTSGLPEDYAQQKCGEGLRCVPGVFQTGGICLKELGQECFSATDCVPEASICSNGICENTLSHLNQSCYSDNDCITGDFRCYNKQCKYKVLENNDAFYSEEFKCNSDKDCYAGDTYSSCIKGICRYLTPLGYNKNTTLKPCWYGLVANSSGYCLDTDICRFDGTVACEAGKSCLYDDTIYQKLKLFYAETTYFNKLYDQVGKCYSTEAELYTPCDGTTKHCNNGLVCSQGLCMHPLTTNRCVGNICVSPLECDLDTGNCLSNANKPCLINSHCLGGTCSSLGTVLFEWNGTAWSINTTYTNHTSDNELGSEFSNGTVNRIVRINDDVGNLHFRVDDSPNVSQIVLTNRTFKEIFIVENHVMIFYHYENGESAKYVFCFICLITEAETPLSLNILYTNDTDHIVLYNYSNKPTDMVFYRDVVRDKTFTIGGKVYYLCGIFATDSKIFEGNTLTQFLTCEFSLIRYKNDDLDTNNETIHFSRTDIIGVCFRNGRRNSRIPLEDKSNLIKVQIAEASMEIKNNVACFNITVKLIYKKSNGLSIKYYFLSDIVYHETSGNSYPLHDTIPTVDIQSKFGFPKFAETYGIPTKGTITRPTFWFYRMPVEIELNTYDVSPLHYESFISYSNNWSKEKHFVLGTEEGLYVIIQYDTANGGDTRALQHVIPLPSNYVALNTKFLMRMYSKNLLILGGKCT